MRTLPGVYWLITRLLNISRMAICSYCREDKKPSREHIYSNALLRLFDDVAPITFVDHRGIAHKGDPIIRDLCMDCNNGLSDCDSEMTRVAEKYLRDVIRRGTTLEYDPRLVLRWLVKTGANITRATDAERDWWHTCIPFIIGRDTELSRADAFFSPWIDLSPYGFAGDIGAVHCIHSREALLVAFEAGRSQLLREQFSFCCATKIGHGVFLLIIWRPDENTQMRASVYEELLQYGWHDINAVSNITSIAYNTSSSTTFNVIANPERHISDAIAADKNASANGA